MPSITPNISLGNLLNIFAMIVAVVNCMGKHQQRGAS
jgi:hypothetical protein